MGVKANVIVAMWALWAPILNGICLHLKYGVVQKTSGQRANLIWRRDQWETYSICCWDPIFGILKY